MVKPDKPRNIVTKNLQLTAGKGREAAQRAAQLQVPADNPRLRLRKIGEGIADA